ncbi:hypothetical protein B0H11DRAFT_283304 [Mycena galericulata]|nr:hypothetical protein B0H11DRAFT_283304 [Mycena galericulata]
MYIFATIHMGTRWFLVKSGFIDHGDSAVTTIAYLLVNPLWLATLPAIRLTMNTLVADCILIWRCWTVWNREFKIVLLPILCTLGGAALGFLSVAEQARYVINPQLNRATYIDFATPYFSLSLATTLLATFLIILRIVFVTRLAGETLRGYRQVIEMTVESAALYSATLVVFLPFLVRQSFNNGYPQAVLAQMTGIAPTLIVARVSFGLARPNESWQAQTSPIQFEATPEEPHTSINLSNIMSPSAESKSEILAVS